MMVTASENSPPAPRPWIARYAASSGIDRAMLHASEPATNTEIATRNSGLRPCTSLSRP